MPSPLRVVLYAFLLCASSAALAQVWPAKPVRIIVPFPPGGNVDMTARLFADALAKRWEQPVIVDNRPGGNQAVAAVTTKNAAPDGYSYLFAGSSIVVTNPLLVKSLPYEARDFLPVALISEAAFVLIINPEVIPARTVSEMVAFAKKQPGKLSFASDNPRGTSGILGEMFNLVAGIDAVHVPFKGSADQIRETLAGRTAYTFNSLAPLVPFIKSGKLRAIAVTGTDRMPGLEGVPKISETYPGFEYAGWFMFFAPAATPAGIVQRVNQDIGVLLKDPAFAATLLSYGQVVEKAPGTPKSLADFLGKENNLWERAFKAAKIEPE